METNELKKLKTKFRGAPDSALQELWDFATAKGLNPYTGEVVLTKSKSKGQTVWRPYVTRDGLITLASRSGRAWGIELGKAYRGQNPYTGEDDVQMTGTLRQTGWPDTKLSTWLSELKPANATAYSPWVRTPQAMQQKSTTYRLLRLAFGGEGQPESTEADAADIDTGTEEEPGTETQPVTGNGVKDIPAISPGEITDWCRTAGEEMDKLNGYMHNLNTIRRKGDEPRPVSLWTCKDGITEYESARAYIVTAIAKAEKDLEARIKAGLTTLLTKAPQEQPALDELWDETERIMAEGFEPGNLDDRWNRMLKVKLDLTKLWNKVEQGEKAGQ